MSFSVDTTGYVHQYEAYRVPKGTTVKNSLGEDIVLSEDEDKLVLTEKASKQLVKDRFDYGNALHAETEKRCMASQDEALKKQAKEQLKALSVFRSMSKGDVVPSSDESKLMEYDPKLYQMAKMAQLMAQMAEENAEKKKSEWDQREEEEDRKRQESLNADAKEAIEGMGAEFGEFSAEQKSNIVEVDSSNIDFSSLKVMNLGSDVTGAFIDLSL